MTRYTWEHETADTRTSEEDEAIPLGWAYNEDWNAHLNLNRFLFLSYFLSYFH